MLFREKKAANGIAKIYLRLLDNGNYLPVLCVVDEDDIEIFRAELPETIDLNAIGEIQLNRKQVIVKPRKNAIATDLQAISFDIKINQ